MHHALIPLKTDARTVRVAAARYGGVFAQTRNRRQQGKSQRHHWDQLQKPTATQRWRHFNRLNKKMTTNVFTNRSIFQNTWTASTLLLFSLG
jgi:hypothetical protein